MIDGEAKLHVISPPVTGIKYIQSLFIKHRMCTRYFVYLLYEGDGPIKGIHTKREESAGLFAHLNTIEFVKAGPSPRLSQTFKELTHGLVVQAIRAVKHHTLQTNH